MENYTEKEKLMDRSYSQTLRDMVGLILEKMVDGKTKEEDHDCNIRAKL